MGKLYGIVWRQAEVFYISDEQYFSQMRHR